MSWNLTEDIVLWATTFPKSSLQKLQFGKAFLSINSYLDLQEKIESLASLAKHRCIAHIEDRKSRKKIIKIFECKEVLTSEHVAQLPEDLKRLATSWNQLISNWVSARVSLDSFFYEDLRANRKKLWDLYASEKMKDSLIELSPTFLGFLEKYETAWDQKPRDSQMKQRENSMINYLSRFCFKAAVCGTSGVQNRVEFQGNHYVFPDETNKGYAHVKAFASVKFVNQIVEKLKQNGSIIEKLPVYFAPMTLIENGKLIFVGKVENKEHVLLVSPKTKPVDFEIEGKSISDFACPEIKTWLLQCLNVGAITQHLDVPVGTYEPLEHVLSVLKSSKSNSPEMMKVINGFQSLIALKNEFSNASYSKRLDLLNQAEHVYETLTGEKAISDRDGFYADKFLFYLDGVKSDKTFYAPERIKSIVEKDLSLAYELAAPLWLLQVIKAYGPMLIQFEELLESQPKTKQDLIQGLIKVKHAPGTLSLQELAEYDVWSEWLTDISDLMKLRDGIFKQVPQTGSVFKLDALPEVSNYREKFIAMFANKSVKLPVFLSCPLFQIHKLGTEEKVVFDSAIFGNAMHLMILTYFSVNQIEIAQETINIFCKIMGVEESEVLANVVFQEDQTNKFFPGVFPGFNLALPSSPASPGAVTLTQNDLLWNEEGVSLKGKKMVPMIPASLRHSFKLVHEKFQSHCPRLEFGNAVLQREQWWVKTEVFKLTEDLKKDPSIVFLEVVKRKNALDLPDQIFVASFGDEKSIFIDFKNFFLVEVFLSLCRKADVLLVGEVLPGFPNDVDASGQNDYATSYAPFIFYKP